MVAGEVRHIDGISSMRRAKRWLEYSTRVAQCWTCLHRVQRDLLAFEWPHSEGSFSFDLGGVFRGGALHDTSFLAEVKGYRNESDLPTEFRDFLAKCYVAFIGERERCDHFLWISWSPFQAKTWSEHRKPEKIRRALLHNDNRRRVLGAESDDEAKQAIDESVVFEVSRRIWLLTLCDEQEDLVITKEHFGDLLGLMHVKYGDVDE
jgi:hypothetical protein